MVVPLRRALIDLYETDETAWFDEMARLISSGQLNDLDYRHLEEHLGAMAQRDRDQVYTRLTVLLAHLLKWQFQPGKRTGSWKATIVHQQLKLRLRARKGSLRRHAEESLDEVFRDAIKEAAAETGLPLKKFPKKCGWTLDQLINDDLLGE